MMQDPYRQEVDRLHSAFTSYTQENRRVTRISLVITLTILSIFGIFATINISRLRTELTHEKLTQSMRSQLFELQPKALEELRTLGSEIAPVYAAELQTQARAKSPQISRRITNELEHLISDILARTQARLRTTEERVLESCAKSITIAYPEISSDKVAQQRLTQRIREVTEGSILSSVSGFDGLFAPDLKRFQETLLLFPLNDTNESKADLQKRFLRLWLQLLDQEIMEL